MADDMVMVAGATGYLGRHLVEALHGAGWRVRALARSPEKLKTGGGGLSSGRAPDVLDRCADVFVGEATRPETLEGLCDGCRVAISVLGKRTMGRRPPLEQVDRDANLNVLARAREAGVERFVFVSVLEGDLLAKRGVPVAVAREAVVEAVRESGIPYTVVRPTGFFNDMEEFFRMAQKGTGWVFGDGSQRINPIHGADLATAIAGGLADPTWAGTEQPLGGPETYTLRGILELAFEVLGTPPKIRSVPFWVLGAAAAMARPFSPMGAGLLAAFYQARDLQMVGRAVGTHGLRTFYELLAAER